MFFLDLYLSYYYFFPTMLPFEVAVAYLAGIVSFVLMYILFKQQEATIHRLKARTIVLSNWLQIAEIQTGTGYYSAVSTGAEPEETNPRFHTYLQDSIKNRGLVRHRHDTDFVDDEPTHVSPHELS